MSTLIDLPQTPGVISMDSDDMRSQPPRVPSAFTVGLPHPRTNLVVEAAMAAGIGLRQFGTPESLLESAASTSVGCVLLWSDRDITQTADVIHQLRAWFQTMPVVVLHDSDQAAAIVTLMQAGAYSVHGPTMTHEALVDTITSATDASLRNQDTIDEGRDASARMKQATPKEREVLDLIMAGKKNREIAAEVGITVRAVEDRRVRLMKKVQAESVAELVATAVQARYYEQGFSDTGAAGSAPGRPMPTSNCLKGIEVWTPSAADDCLELSQSVYRDAAYFRETSTHMTFRRGEGLPGRVWTSRAPVFMRELITTDFVRSQAASAVGMTTAIGFPIFASGEIQSIILLLLDTRYQMKAAFESWHYDPAVSSLKLAGGTYVNCERLRRLTEFMSFPVGSGLPGIAAEQRLPCAGARFAEGTAAVRGVALAAERLMSGVALPLTDSGNDISDVFLLFNAESSPVFSLLQVWKPTADGTRLTLVSEHVDGVPSLTSQLQEVSQAQLSGPAHEAWVQGHPVVVNTSEDLVPSIPTALPGTCAAAGIAIPTIVDGVVSAVTVLAG